MASPYFCHGGLTQGRIEPVAAVPADGLWVFCLGWDTSEPMQDFLLEPGEEVSVYQDATEYISGIKLVQFAWRMRTPRKMPQLHTLIAAGAVEFVTGGLYRAGDGCRGVKFASALCSPDDGDQLISISGSANPANNGTFRSSAATDCVVQLENADLVAGAESGITVTVLGARWAARAYVNDILRAELIEPAGHEVAQRALTMNISQLSGAAVIKFSLALESVEA